MGFINRLDKLRKDKGVTKKKLLDDCNLGKNQYAYWEKNETVPTPSVLKVLAQYFDVSVDYLIGKTDKKEKPSTETDDGLSPEFKSLYRQLTPEQKSIVLGAMREFVKEK